MRILVLGWEYPPAVAGGLGAACQGLTSALAARGHTVQLALPDACRSYRAGAGDGELELGSPDPIYQDPIYLNTGPRGEEVNAGDRFHPYAVDAPAESDGAGAAAQAGPPSSPASWGAAGRGLYGRDLESSVRCFTASALEQLRSLDFDVIHAHDWMTYPAALRLRLAARRPACLHVHSTSFDRGGASQVVANGGRGTIASVERAGVRTADVTCAVSGYTKSVLVDHYGADERRVHVVHNAPSASDTSALARHGDAGATTRSSGPPTVLFLGRLTRQKGVGFFLRAAALVLQRHPDARFLLAGDGEERTALIETAAELGVARRVFFLGSISDAAKTSAYRSADAFVLPSVSEPFGLTPLEALAQGTPVVLTRTSGVAEVLPSAPAVEPWDISAMAAEITAILDSRGVPGGHAEQLVTLGRREAAALSWESSAAALEKALASAVRASGMRGAAQSSQRSVWARSAAAAAKGGTR